MSMSESFFTKVAGSSHYQKAISKCYEGRTCQLVPETDNPHDKSSANARCQQCDQLLFTNSRFELSVEGDPILHQMTRPPSS